MARADKARGVREAPIEMGVPRHATLDVADIDGDGDIDIVTGYFSINKPAESWVQIWLNQSKQPAK